MGYSAGGSSSGSAALVAAGEVELSIGGDQGGSIRMPASYCGIVGLKPTWGLVPYTGVMPIELTLDHTGPMTANVADNALMLEVIAGPDGLDPRQSQTGSKPVAYTEALGTGVKGLRIGVVKEGFGLANSEADVDAKVRAAAERFKKLGATVEEVSVPMHALGPIIWTPIACEGATQQMMKDNGHGFNWKGLYVTSLIDAHSQWRSPRRRAVGHAEADDAVGEWFIQTGRGRFYAQGAEPRAQAARRLRRRALEVRRAADADAARQGDAAAAPGRARELIVQRAFEMLPNTCPTDATRPPCAAAALRLSDGLPVGMMLIGKHYDELTLYRAGHAFEQSGDWKSM